LSKNCFHSLYWDTCSTEDHKSPKKKQSTSCQRCRKVSTNGSQWCYQHAQSALSIIILFGLHFGENGYTDKTHPQIHCSYKACNACSDCICLLSTFRKEFYRKCTRFKLMTDRPWTLSTYITKTFCDQKSHQWYLA
jgi:hypothetical protein